MAEHTETLAFIDCTRTKACTLYAVDKIALPIVKSLDLMERMVKGDVDEKTLSGDVKRLLDEVDYTRNRDEKRDDQLRSVISDLCKVIGLASREIGAKKATVMDSETATTTAVTALKSDSRTESAGKEGSQQASAPLPTMPQPCSSSSLWMVTGGSTAGYPSQPVKQEGGWDDPIYVDEVEQMRPKEEEIHQAGNEPSTSFLHYPDGDDNSSHASLPVLSYLKRAREIEDKAQSKRKNRRTSAKRYLDDDVEEEKGDKESDYDEEPDYAPAGLERTRMEEPKEDGMYHCRFCPKKFAKLHGLRTHAFTHNLAIPCTICHVIVKKDNMQRHMCVVHNGADPVEDPVHMPLFTLPCPICGQMCMDEGHLNRHMRTHSGDNPFPCPHCESSLRSAALRNRHIRLIHLVQPWECATCGVQYARDKELKDHLMVNRGHLSLLQD